MTQKYDKEFKMNAVKLYLSHDQSLDKIATDLGIPRASLGKWVSSYKRDGNKSFPGSGHVVNEELNAHNIGLRVLAGAGAQIDTRTPNGKMVFNLFAVLAEFERELIVERTRAGLAAARARGRVGGRPRKMDKATLTMAMAAMANPKSVAAEVAKRLGMTTTTLYMYVNGDGTLKELSHKILQLP